VTDERRLELERYFDGELPPDRQARIARRLPEDGEARLHLRRMARLRALARSHETAAIPVPRPHPTRPQPARVLAVAAAAVAAIVAIAVVRRGRTSSDDVPGAPGPAAIVAPAPVVGPSVGPAPIREVELYTWANRDRRRPDSAARAILRSGARSGKRAAAAEVLALDLANADSELAEDLEPLALLHKSPPGGRVRMERHARRPRPVAPRT
jgi:hypothetical protein